MRVLKGFSLLCVLLTWSACDRAREPEPAAEPSPFAGEYSGAWVAANDTTDFGTANWTIDAAGNISGTDNEMKTGATVRVAGSIDAQGNLTSRLTPADKPDTTTLNGALAFDAQNQLVGVLHWSGPPPTSYHYTLMKR